MFGAVGFGDNVETYLFIALGVAVGVILPVLSRLVRERFQAAAIDFTPYLLLLAFSLVMGLVILAAMRNSKPDEAISWYAAFLAGYAGEATLEKLLKPS